MIRRLWSVLAATVLLTTTTPAHAAPVEIKPGAVWTDTAGGRLQAHGAGILKDGGTYYMVGEDKTAGQTFTAVACYSSTDLANWTRQPNALTRQPSGDLAADRVVERPKILRNAATGKYVMWMHIDTQDYRYARVGVAVADRPCGPYTYQGSFRPQGYESRDMGLFQDDDGTAYLMAEDRPNGLRIFELTADYTQIKRHVALIAPALESPAILKTGGRYFLLGSHLTGWSPNDNSYITATSLAGPWSAQRGLAPASTKTFSSQTSFVLPVTGTGGTTYMYVGDRWNSGNLNDSRQVWLPLTVSGDTVRLPKFYQSWTIDTATGRWAATSQNIVGNPSQRCLDVAGQSTSNGTRTTLWDCNGGENQSWVVNATGELRVYSGTKCLDVRNQSTANGAEAIIWDCNNSVAQKWQTRSDGTIYNVHTGRCLAASAAGTSNGTGAILWTCSGGNEQKWTRRA